MLGSWNVNITVGKFPQKVASALADLKIVGAEYNPIAYIGSQQVNGVNHAILAEQVLTVGKDVRNVVILILNEKDEQFTLTGIERIVEQGAALGGIQIAQDFTVTDEAKAALAAAMEGFVGIKVEPVALLGTQVVKGTNYILFAQVTGVVVDETKEAAVIIANDLTKKIGFSYVLSSKDTVGALGYAFNWLVKQNVALGKPLGEWP